MKKNNPKDRTKEKKVKENFIKAMNFLYLGLSLVFMEIVIKIYLGVELSARSAFLFLLFSFSAGLAIYFVFSFFKYKVIRILHLVALAFLAVIFSSQLVYYEAYKNFYNIAFAAAGAGDLTEFMPIVLNYIGKTFYWIIILFIPFIGYFFLPKISPAPLVIKGRKILFVKKTTVYAVLSALVLHLIALGIIYSGGKDFNSPYDLYHDDPHPYLSVSNFGLFTAMRLDIKINILNLGGSGKTTGKEAVSENSSVVMSGSEYLQSGDNSCIQNSGDSLSNISDNASPVSDSANSSGYISDVNSSGSTPEKQGYNIMDIDFQKLYETEKDPEIKEMHRYFSSVEPTNKNQFTGLFKDFNLILITAESYSYLAIDENITPTLYKMTHEGMNFTNFYNAYFGSTTAGEYIATTGLISQYGNSMKQSATKYMAFAMGRQFQKLGYPTFAYHNHTYTYYDRHITHPNLGYDVYKGVGNGLNIRKIWPGSDLEMMEASIPDYIDKGKFHAYYMTVSGHFQYNFTGNSMAVKNKKYVEHLPYSTPAKAYLAGQIEFDRALEYLLTELDKAGVAEKTLIVVSADHYPYALSWEDINQLAGKEVERDFERDKSSLLIYAKGMKPLVVDKPTSSLDIIPTISNLLGLEYDSRLLMGIDVFSDAPPLIIFDNRSFITEKGRYNTLTGRFESADGGEVDAEYIKKIQGIVRNKFDYSVKILKKDYYKKVVP